MLYVLALGVLCKLLTMAACPDPGVKGGAEQREEHLKLDFNVRILHGTTEQLMKLYCV